MLGWLHAGRGSRFPTGEHTCDEVFLMNTCVGAHGGQARRLVADR